MTPLAVVFLLANSLALLLLPRRWVIASLLAGCFYMTVGQGVQIAGINFPMYRMFLLVALFRTIVRGEQLQGGFNAIDKLILAWALWVFLASLFQPFEEGSGPVYALGMIFNISLVYFLVRIWCQDLDELRTILAMIAILLVPVALEMLQELKTGRNFFSIFGGVSPEVMIREGKLRASGPFKHAILAGSVGAACLPLMIGIWRRNKIFATIGIGASVLMVLASHSSGPLMSMMFGLMAVGLWRFRLHLIYFQILAVLGYFAFQFYSGRPGYYIISRIDLTGGSTGYHRARLIESAFEHFNEWWLIGTNYTRHWMATGVSFSEKHTDITNYYIAFGILGGFLSMALIIIIFGKAFLQIAATIRQPSISGEDAFLVWCLGAGLFAHAATSISVSYFDQSMTFVWLNVAIISSLSTLVFAPAREEEPVSEPKEYYPRFF